MNGMVLKSSRLLLATYVALFLVGTLIYCSFSYIYDGIPGFRMRTSRSVQNAISSEVTSSRRLPRVHARADGPAAESRGDDWLNLKQSLFAPSDEIGSAYVAQGEEDEGKKAIGRSTKASSSALVDLSIKLLSSNSAKLKLEGYKILSDLPVIDSDRFDLIIKGMRTEQDPNVLAELTKTVQKSVWAPGQKAALLEQFKLLLESSSDTSKAAGLSAIAQWDHSEQSQQLVANAIVGLSPSMREAAINAVWQNDLNSEAVKASLEQLLLDPDASVQLKTKSFNIVSKLKLTQHDYDMLLQFKNSLGYVIDY